MKKLKTKFTTIFTLILFILNIITYSIPVHALTIGSGENDKIHLEINSDKRDYTDGEFFELNMKYKILGELGTIKENDQFTFNILEEFKNIDINYPREHFKEMKRDGNTITLIFGENVKKALAGYIKLKGRIESSSKTTTKNMTVKLNGDTITSSDMITIQPRDPIPIPPVPATPSPNGNNGNNKPSIINRLLLKDIEDHIGFDSDENIISEVTGLAIGKTKKYILYVNEKFSEIRGASLKDIMPSGMELIPSSIKIKKIDLNNISTDETNSISKSANATMLDVYLGDINCMYILEYTAKFTTELNSYKNTAELTTDTESVKSSVIVNKKTDDTNIISKSSYNVKQIQTSDGKTLKVASLNDKISYTIYLNEDKLYLDSAFLEDFIPKGMKYVPNSLSVGEYDTNGNFSWVTDKFKDKITLTDEKISINLGNTENKFAINYKLEIVSPEESYVNKAKINYNSISKEAFETVNYEMNIGAINAEKIADKITIKKGEDNSVIYTIAFESFGFFEKNYLSLIDSLDKRVKILRVEAPEQFSANIDYNTNIVKIVNDKKDINYGDNLQVKIYTDFSSVDPGSTVNNVAKINEVDTNQVKTKKGYAFSAKKVDSNNESKTLEGAKFLLKDNDLNTIKELITTTDGTLKSEIPFPGTYYLEEISAPKGYKLLKEKIKFDIKESDIGTTLNLGNIKNEKTELVVSNASIEKVEKEPWETVSDFNTLNHNEATAVSSTEEGLNKPSSQKPTTLVDGTELTEPNWETVSDLNNQKPNEVTAASSTEKGPNKPSSQKPTILVDKTQPTETLDTSSKSVIDKTETANTPLENSVNKEIKLPKTGDKAINGYFLVLVSSILGLIIIRRK